MAKVAAREREVLAACYHERTPVFFAGDALGITFQSFIVGLDEGRILVENRIKPRYVNEVMRSSRFTLQARMIRFASMKLASDGEHIVFPLAEAEVLEETRQSERYGFSADEQVIAEILNPFDGETRISKTVMDMSATGLSIRTTFDSQLFRQGTVLPSVRVLIDGEPYAQAQGRVVYSRKLMDLSGQLRLQVGIKFEGKGA